MATPRQIAANRRNAQKSTGPRTDAGKRRVARNALRHGLRAKSVDPPGRDSEEFRELVGDFLESLQPRDDLEHQAVLAVAMAEMDYRLLLEHEAQVLAVTDYETLPGKLVYLASLNSKIRNRFFSALARFDELRDRPDHLFERTEIRQTNPIEQPRDEAKPGELREQTQSDGEPEPSQPRIRRTKPIRRATSAGRRRFRGAFRRTKPICRPRTQPPAVAEPIRAGPDAAHCR